MVSIKKGTHVGLGTFKYDPISVSSIPDPSMSDKGEGVAGEHSDSWLVYRPLGARVESALNCARHESVIGQPQV